MRRADPPGERPVAVAEASAGPQLVLLRATDTRPVGHEAARPRSVKGPDVRGTGPLLGLRLRPLLPLSLQRHCLLLLDGLLLPELLLLCPLLCCEVSLGRLLKALKQGGPRGLGLVPCCSLGEHGPGRGLGFLLGFEEPVSERPRLLGPRLLCRPLLGSFLPGPLQGGGEAGGLSGLGG